jgi:signal peptidase I
VSTVQDSRQLVVAPSAAVLSARGSVAMLILRLAVAAILGFVGVLGLSLAVPRVLGYQVFTVLSGSMEPTLGVGDIVVEAPLSPRDARVGDVITFRSPENQARLVTHRVVHVRASGDTVSFETRGDANSGREHWSIAADGVLGRVSYHVPKLGYLTNRLGSRFGRLGLIVVPALLLGLYELKRIWRPARP